MSKIKTTFKSFLNESESFRLKSRDLRKMQLVSNSEISIDSTGLLYDSFDEHIDEILEIDGGIIKREDIEPIVEFISENEEDLFELVEYERHLSLDSFEYDEEEVENSNKNMSVESAKRYLREALEHRI